MSNPLPVGKFQFLSQTEIDQFDPMSVPADGDTGYIFECDVIYPEHLHSSHSDYPLAPEHLTVNAEMLSPFTIQFIDKQRKSLKTNTKPIKQKQICHTLQKLAILFEPWPNRHKNSPNFILPTTTLA